MTNLLVAVVFTQTEKQCTAVGTHESCGYQLYGDMDDGWWSAATAV